MAIARAVRINDNVWIWKDLGRWPERRKLSCSVKPRVVHGPGAWLHGLAGRVTILPDFGGSGQHFGFFSFFTDYFLVPESIGIFEYYIRINWFSTIFDI